MRILLKTNQYLDGMRTKKSKPNQNVHVFQQGAVRNKGTPFDLINQSRDGPENRGQRYLSTHHSSLTILVVWEVGNL